MTADYAVRDDSFGGREHYESIAGYLPFELDRHRIITCTAFRRLQGKTQVFGPGQHDHFRTRLTHTLEVSQIARSLGRRLAANESLAEAIALAHDLGHPPFGHAGEAALDQAMADCGGFNHNTHSLRVVEYLEHPFPAFRGLNLTGATRAGLAAHCTRYDTPAATNPHESGLGPSVEAQIASVADRYAYNCHDLEDAIGQALVTEDELSEIELWRTARAAATADGVASSIHAVRRRVLDELLERLLVDVTDATAQVLQRTAKDCERWHPRETAVALSTEGERRLQELEAFLRERVYRQADVVAADEQGRRVIGDLFAMYQANLRLLPQRFATRLDEQGTARVIGDYIAGMTNAFCLREHDAHC